MPKQDFARRYSDLLGKQQDARLLDLIEKLDAAYTSPVSLPDSHQFSALVQRSRLLRTTNPAEIRRWSLPSRQAPGRLMLVAIAALVMILLTAAGIPLLQQAISGAAQGQTGLPLNAYQNLHQSRTLPGTGITLTLEKGYADANRVLLIYTYTLPQKYGDDQIAPLGTMTAEPHLILPDSTSGKIWNTAHDASSSKTAGILSYNTSSLPATAGTLRLHLTVTRIIIEEKGFSGQEPVFDGTLSFDFTLPFHPGKVLQLHQSVTSNGEMITLERVVITHTETAMFFNGIQNLDQLSVKQLTGGKFQQDYEMSFTGANCHPKIDPSSGCQVELEIPSDNMDATGPWSIALMKKLSNKPNEASWTFHFHIQ
jgi:hypothetical protein